MTAVLAPTAFRVDGPLPTGTTVLEASAGTGKTFTIAALAARYVADGIAELPQLMLVTFGREATQELRERVRARLVDAERALADPAAARDGGDEVNALLAGGTDDEVALRRTRLARALAGFDAATIATTHQFCQQMLAGLGVAGDADADAEFVESIDDLVTEVVDDFYVRKYGDRAAGTPAFSR
ncbi:MAG: exodeoxyribonuclease beta subunit, partial [Pseudonocardiales bacterium]|nr:exodeoxyribonuclease beta subunit [Pseudonocardiales bacterium]